MLEWRPMKFAGSQPLSNTQVSETSLSWLQPSPCKLPATAFEEWYRDFSTIVEQVTHTKVTNRHSAEDIIQNIWIKVAQVLDSYDSTRSSRITFLGQIIRSCIIDFHRRENACLRVPPTPLQPLTEDESSNQRLSFAIDPERNQIQIDDSDFCRFHLAKLPARQRQAIEAYYLQQIPIERIAEQFGITIQAAHSILYHGRRELYRVITSTERPKHGKQGRRMRSLPLPQPGN